MEANLQMELCRNRKRKMVPLLIKILFSANVLLSDELTSQMWYEDGN
jgi:hypothetical protein